LRNRPRSSLVDCAIDMLPSAALDKPGGCAYMI
jgi:hypothetical protein